jgi:gamma-glutamylcyclotransferase (GGCT)/AIG2-like uncharacterized protein YtfP
MPDETAPPQWARCVFVYGTLRRGGANDINRLRPAPQWVGYAQLAGDMYHLGAYPGVVLRPAGARIVGEIYRIDPLLEPVLDAIEGLLGPHASDEYVKREVDVPFGSQLLRCLLYEINPRYVAGAARIVHGDWTQA